MSTFDPENCIVDTATLAYCLHLSERHINRLANDGILHRHIDAETRLAVGGQWNLQAAIADFLHYKRVPRDPSGY